MALREQRTVTVPGVGSAAAAPDVVRVALTAVGSGPTAGDALAACSAAQGAAVGQLRAAGGTDLRAGAVRVHQEWDHEHNRQGEPQGTAEVSATLPDLATAAAAATEVLRAGGDRTRLQALSPQVADPEPGLAQAREAAFADARSRAAAYARLAGAGLGPLLQLAEGGARITFMEQEVSYSSGRSRGAHMELGMDVDLTVQVTATFALVDADVPTDSTAGGPAPADGGTES